jgi:tetratricopeptide (TPR) repeat protein
LLTGLEWWLTFSGGGCWVESLDFRVEISGDAARGYEVVLRAPDGVEVSATKQLPVPAVELDALAARIPDAVIASSATVRYSPSREERPVQQLGGLLFDLVLAEQGRGMLAASRHQADREGRQLRIVLQVRPPELARLPWEFMFDSGEDDYICLSTVLVRYPQVPAPVRRLQVNGPLRVLGMAARPGDQQALATAAERQRLHEALGGLQRAGRIELDWVPGQTWRDLRNAMRHGSWNVLHFIGHGGFDAAAQEGTLALADDGGDGTYRLGADNLAMLLRAHPALRLVVLNACDTGRATALDIFSSVAGALIRRGVPAVLAMQHEITDQAALEFSRTFYEELADQPAVDRCVMQARQAVRLALPGSLEWGTPVLYMRSADSVLFDPAGPPGSGQAAPVLGDPARQVAGDGAGEREDLYTQALAALYTDRWDDAIQGFRALTAGGGGFKDSAARLEQARRGQRLAALYTAGRGAAAAGRWEEAIEHLEAVVAAEPGYQDAQPLLEQARREQTVAALRAEAAALHRAGQWQAVLAVGERLRALAPDAPDPDGLISSAQAELQAIQRTRTLDEAYQQALRHISAAEWRPALRELVAIGETEPGYKDTAQLADRARRELARTAPDIGQPVMQATIRAPKGVNAVAFSPDGNRLALACDGRQTLVVDLTGRQQLRVRPGGWRTYVFDVAFDPAGGRLATASDDSTARIWGADTGTQLAPGHPHRCGEWRGVQPGRAPARHRQQRQDRADLGRQHRHPAAPGHPHGLGAGRGVQTRRPAARHRQRRQDRADLGRQHRHPAAQDHPHRPGGGRGVQTRRPPARHRQRRQDRADLGRQHRHPAAPGHSHRQGVWRGVQPRRSAARHRQRRRNRPAVASCGGHRWLTTARCQRTSSQTGSSPPNGRTSSSAR